MHNFRSFVLNEVKASKANIALFKQKYGNNDVYDDQVAQSEAEAGTDEAEFIEDWIDEFNDQVKRGTLKQKDIFGFKDFSDFLNQMETAAAMKSGSELKRLEKEGAVRVFENDKGSIIHPMTHAASCHYGAGSQWCTAAREPSNFDSYTNKQGVVLLYFLPKGGRFEPTEKLGKQPVASVPMTEETRDELIFLWPNVFEYTGQFGKSVGKYIKAAYLNKRQSEPLDVIASWSPENAEAIKNARTRMEMIMTAWNENGSDIVKRRLGTLNHEGLDNGAAKDNLIAQAITNGLLGMMRTAWADIYPWEHGYDPLDIEEYRLAEPVMKILHDNPGNISVDPVDDRRFDKLAVAVYAMRPSDEPVDDDDDPEDHIDAMEQATGLSHAFGKYAAEGYDAQDQSIGVDEIIKMAGLSTADVAKLSEYIIKFSTDKVWEDKDPQKILEYMTMRYRQNATPENIARADEFFLNEPKAVYNRSAWDYALQIHNKGWPELEKLLIDELDLAASTGIKIINWKKKTREWSGYKELEAHVQELEKKRGQKIEEATPIDWLNSKHGKWKERFQSPLSRFLGNANGLLKYLYNIKRYDWPELEKRILDPEYFSIGLTWLGPDWIQHGRNGKRWKELEGTLLQLWDDTTTNPFTNQKQWDAASSLKNTPGVTPPERERAKDNIAQHMSIYGDVEDVIKLVKATKNAIGGGTGGSESAAWNAAKDAWWNDPETVAKYWGHGSIAMKQKPRQKKRGYDATKWFVTDKRVPRPFYHEVEPGAWLAGIPNIFTLSNTHIDPQFVGDDPDKPEIELPIGQQVTRHDASRRGSSTFRNECTINSNEHGLIWEAYTSKKE